jgi:site-specific recombinase XerD
MKRKIAFHNVVAAYFLTLRDRLSFHSTEMRCNAKHPVLCCSLAESENTAKRMRYHPTFVLERGMPIEQIQKFLGHAKLETTQVYPESTPEMIMDSYRRALAE